MLLLKEFCKEFTKEGKIDPSDLQRHLHQIKEQERLLVRERLDPGVKDQYAFIPPEIDAHVDLVPSQGFHHGWPRAHPSGGHEHGLRILEFRRIPAEEGLDAVLHGKRRHSLECQKRRYLRMTALPVEKAHLASRTHRLVYGWFECLF